MNTNYVATELPLSQLVTLLSPEPIYRQSVVFLSTREAGQIEAGDFVIVESNTHRNENADNDYPSTLFAVTHILSGEEGIAPGFLAVSLRPLEDDELTTCHSCGGSGTVSESDQFHTQYYSCDECCGVGKVAEL